MSDVNPDFIAPVSEFESKVSKKSIFVTFQKEGLHRWPDAINFPGVEFLANEHRHMFHFRVEMEVFHDDREVEFILFKRELEKLYGDGAMEIDLSLIHISEPTRPY